MRIVLTLAPTFNWVIKYIDVNTMFLNGELVDEIYIDKPQGF